MQLESVYGHPGFLLLASDDNGERLGCVGLRELVRSSSPSQISTGEIRRLFVRSSVRHTGLGVALMQRLVDDAVAVGFERLVLNTLPSMVEAIALYERIGFTRSAPYVDEPLDDTLYYEINL